METLIPIINKLQDVFGAIGHQSIDLPQIVVVGSQSSGKSSVLENIVGRDFLPRGTGIVTRRPMVLQLYALGSKGTLKDDIPQHDKSRGEEWGEFLHLPGQKFYDFNEIRNEISRETERVTGKNKGISHKSINLKIYSPHVLDLTLVDLPGITKVPTGDQPEDVEEQIRSMCYEFITNPNAVILAVTAANQDLANSDGLKMARAVDPSGDRTIGVLTKVDIMDSGTDCTDVLNNKVIPLKKGYIAVVNRSQKDIQDGLPIRDGLKKETEYFQSHPKYRSYLSKCGTSNLTRTLNSILMHHIRDTLPDLKSKVSKLLAEEINKLMALGDSDVESPSMLGGTLLRIISKFTINVNTSIEGRGYLSSSLTDSGSGNIEMSELYGGARMSYIFNEIFGKLLWSMDPFEALDDDEIRTAIANANGTRPSLFVPEISFDLLVKKQIARLEAPGIQCVDMIFDEMLRLTYQCELPEMSRFPLLRDRMYEIVLEMLKSCMKPTQQMITNMIHIELSYINTSHPDFIGGKQALALVTKKAQQVQQSHNLQQNSKDSAIESFSENNQNGHAPKDLSAVATPVHNSSKPSTQQTPDPRSINTGNPFHEKSTPTNSFNTPPPHPTSNQNAGFFGLLRMQAPNFGVAPAAPSSSDRENSPPFPTSANITTRNRSNLSEVKPSKPTKTNQNYGEAQFAAEIESESSGLVKLPQMPERMKVTSSVGAAGDWGRREVEVIKTLIRSYFDVVRKTFVDMVPKSVMHFLVNNFREGLQNELVAKLYREQLVAELMRETEDIAVRRHECIKNKEMLQRALEIINEVRDYKAAPVASTFK